ncbi:MAG: fibronectin type III domain-containing protein [Elusimicrobia bacterium]|nr:fibronectin type III domain-containing protein [Elusimicrobiota bacterium]
MPRTTGRLSSTTVGGRQVPELDESGVDSLHQAIRYAYGKGLVVVAAAGNVNAPVEGQVPARWAEVIAVGATDANDERANFSNFGGKISVAAPGVDILSTVPDNDYQKINGTSMACPHVAGVAALLLSTFSTMTNEEIRAVIESSADPIGPGGMGHGRINAKRAVMNYDEKIRPTIPSRLDMVADSAAQLSLTWEGSKDASGISTYLLDLSTNTLFTTYVSNYKQSPIRLGTTFEITNLDPGQRYYARLRAMDSVGNISDFSSTVSATTLADPIPPSPPTRVQMFDSVGDSISVSWSASRDNVRIKGYYLDLSTIQDFSSYVAGYEHMAVGDHTSQVLKNLQPTTKYYARVRAIDPSGNMSGYSSTVSANTLELDTTAPMSPSNVIMGIIDPALNTLELSWLGAVDNVGIKGYYCDLSTDSSFSSFVLGYNRFYVAAGDDPVLTINHLLGDTKYYARVMAKDVSGNSSTYSPTVMASTPGPDTLKSIVLLPPRIIQKGSGEALYYKWFPIKGNVEITGYLMDLSTDPNFSSYIPGFENRNIMFWYDSITNSYYTRVNGLGETPTYYARFRSYDAAGHISQYSQTYSTRANDPSSQALTPPMNPKLTVNSSTELNFDWEVSGNGVYPQYHVDVSTYSDFSLLIAGYEGLVPETTQIITNLQPKTRYYARVNATDKDAPPSAFTPTVSAVTSADVIAPLAPRTLSLSEFGETDPFTWQPIYGGLRFVWSESTDNAGVKGYVIDVSTSPLFSSFVEGYKNREIGDLDKELVMRGFESTTMYYARVRAYDAAGNVSENSRIVNSKPYHEDVLPPSTPTNPKLTMVSSYPTELKFDWNISVDDTDENLSYLLEVSTTATFSPSVKISTHENTYMITDLLPSTRYYARVLATDGFGHRSANSGVVSAMTASDTMAPNIPIIIDSQKLDNGLMMSWVSSPDNVGVKGYLLDLSTDGGFSAFVPGNVNRDIGDAGRIGTRNSLTISEGLNLAPKYFARLRAYDAAGNISAHSKTFSFTVNTQTNVNAPAPTPPANPKLTVISGRNLNLTWEASVVAWGHPSYFVDVSTHSTFSSFVSGYNRNPVPRPWWYGTSRDTPTHQSITNLQPATLYYARVIAMDADGKSSFSRTVSAFTAEADTIVPTAPTDLKLSMLPPAIGTMVLTWTSSTDNVGVAGYGLDVSTTSSFSVYWNSAGSVKKNLDIKDPGRKGSENSFIIDNVDVPFTYFVRLRAYDAMGNISVDSQTVSSKAYAPDIQAPTRPTQPTLTVISSTALRLDWVASTDDQGEPHYIVDVSERSNFFSYVAGYKHVFVGTGTSLSITNLQEGKRYYARVRATDLPGNESPSSATVSVMTPAPHDFSAPTTPTNLTMGLLPPQEGSMILTWSPSTDNVEVKGYSLDLSTNASFSSFVVGYENRDLGISNRYAIQGLNVTDIVGNAQTYYARLRAYDAAGNKSSVSNTVSSKAFTSDTQEPTPPTNPTLTAISITELNLDWVASTDDRGVMSYRVDISTANNFSSFVVGYERLPVSFSARPSITHLQPATKYFARIRAVDYSGNESENSTTVSAMTLAPPDLAAPTAPTNIKMQMLAPTVGSLSLMWSGSTDNKGVKGYFLDLSTHTSFTSYVGGYRNRNIGDSNRNGSDNDFVILALDPAPTYYARLRAYDAAGNISTNSQTVSSKAYTPDTQAPTRPGTPQLTIVSPTSLKLSWGASQDNRGWFWYYVDVSTDPQFSTFVSGYEQLYMDDWETITPHIIISGLKPSTMYYARVMAQDPPGNHSSHTSTVSAQTPAPPDTIAPTAPVRFKSILFGRLSSL